MIRRPASPPPLVVTAFASLALVLACRVGARAAEAEHGAPQAAHEAEHAQEKQEAIAHGAVEKPKAEPEHESPSQKPPEAEADHAVKEHATAPQSIATDFTVSPVPKAAPRSAASHVPAPVATTPAAKHFVPQAVMQSPSPEEIESLLALGGKLTERADYEAAEIAYRQIIDAPSASDADVRTALLGLARMHRRQGMLTKAAAIYERYLKEFPGDERAPDALLDLGRTLRDLGVYKLALTRFYSVINATLKLPGDGFDRYQILAKTAQFEIAETHFQSGDYAEAAKFYARLRLLDLAPADRARAHFKSGYSLRLLGDREAALTTLHAFIEQWPADENIPEARYLVAVTLRELNRPQEAFAATLELLRAEKSRTAADPKRWAYWQRRTGNQLANDFFETGDTLNAQAIYAGLLELSEEPSWRLPITYQLALCYERLGIVDRARAAYQSIVEAAKPATPAATTNDFAELARMAGWRIEHLDWRENTGQQIAKFFGPANAAPAAAAPAAPSSPAAQTALTP